MMIVDLIDGDDFRDRLVALGLEVPRDATPRTCAELAASSHRRRELPGLAALVDELMGKRDVLLPSVRDAIETCLLPGLGRT